MACAVMRNSTSFPYWGAVLLVKISSFKMTASLLQWWFPNIMSPMLIKKLMPQAANIHQYVSDLGVLPYYIQVISSLNLLIFIAFLSQHVKKFMLKGLSIQKKVLRRYQFKSTTLNIKQVWFKQLILKTKIKI